ncbi:MAG TPA: hypothetical protein IGS17_12175 [Oscillatoriales cyanobacterium M59_W2019_021]|nr:hypothetical protein [Oscillatoriales cyanobacterium M59_W2019_021]
MSRCPELEAVSRQLVRFAQHVKSATGVWVGVKSSRDRRQLNSDPISRLRST